MIYPSELELLEFFGVEPEHVEDVTLYRVPDAAGVGLRFSYSDAGESLQTALYVAGLCVCVVCHEGLKRFYIDQGTLRAEFADHECAVALSLTIHPMIRVDWSGLRLS